MTLKQKFGTEIPKYRSENENRKIFNLTKLSERIFRSISDNRP
jgi:hypothetical protein